MVRDPSTSRMVAVVLLLAAAGCAKQGTVTFAVDAPLDTDLSPLGDPRRDTMALTTDDLTGTPIGSSVSASLDAPCPNGGDGLACIGPILVGSYPAVKLTVSGGAQLLGLARTQNVDIASGVDQVVPLHLRKPIAYFGSIAQLVANVLPKPDPLMVLDTTLPPKPLLAPIDTPGTSSATVSTRDGQYVITGAPGVLALIDTRTHSVARMVTITAAAGMPHVRDLTLSDDDQTLAIVTDLGLAVIPGMSGFYDGTAMPMPMVSPVPSLQKVAFSPDGTTLKLLTGPSWQDLTCGNGATSSLSTVTVADPITLTKSQQTPQVATDVRWDQSGLLLAFPCGLGVYRVDPDTLQPDPNPALPGSGIYDIVDVGGELIGIQGGFAQMLVSVDPFDPSLRNQMLPFGQISIAPVNGPSRVTTFTLPPDRVMLQAPAPDGSLPQVRLVPQAIIAYQAAASPDGAHLVFASRLRYSAQNRYIQLVWQGTGAPAFFCELTAVEDVYRVAEIDLNSGDVPFQTVAAIDDKTCSTLCTNCDQLGTCIPDTPVTCAVSDGYIPGGVSVLMGSR